MPTPSLLIVPARFKTGKLYSQIPTSGAGDFTVTRNTEARRFGPDGLIASVASGIPRLDYYTSGGVTGCPALLVEPAATNLALHSRDLSQGVWVKTNVTAVKNAVGADGVASGAITLTATAASGTVLQAIVNISQSRVFSAYVRRVTGTGAVEMTTNGGTNWTAVTISSTYTQVACAAQTVLNGSVGFRMAVSGDVIEVDFTQSEVGPAFTSPIPTTTGSVTRNADVISVTGAVSGSIGQTEGTIYAEVDVRTFTSSAARRIVNLRVDGSNVLSLEINTASTNVEFVATSGGVSVTAVASGLTAGISKIAVGYNSAASGTVLYVNGVLHDTKTIAIPNLSAAVFGLGVRGDGAAGTQLNDRIRAAALYTTRLTNAELQSLTQL